MLISVVIPVYNGEKFLSRAVDSVLAQQGGNVEIVLVNDGSTDGSAQLCDTYAREYDHVRVVHKQNGGLSSARNAGMAAARGEYFLFLDADDYLDPDTCTEIEQVIRLHHPDCIDFGWKYVGRNGEISATHHKIPKNVLLGEDVLRDKILPPLLNLRQDPDHFIFDFSCTKVFRADLIRNNLVTFDENRRIWEDRPFVVHYLKFCRNFYSIDRCFYNYVDMPGSLSRRYSLDFFRIILENFRLYQSLYGNDYDFDTAYVNSYWSRSIENMIYRSLEQKDQHAQIRRNILDTLGQPQVKHWFAGRQTEVRFEQTQSALIASENCEKALARYKTHAAFQRMAQSVQTCRGLLARAVRKLIGG